MFVELWTESKATPILFERRIKDKIKEIETFGIHSKNYSLND
jgi:hypothetical protein